MRYTIYCLLVYIVVLIAVFSDVAYASNDAVFALRPIEAPTSGGTGFLIEHNGQQMLLSNRHVCEISDTGVFIAQNDTHKIAAIVSTVALADDLCLLTLNKSVDVTPLVVARHRPAPGSLVHSDGYPKLQNQVRNIGLLVAYEAQIGFYKKDSIIVMGKTSFRAIPGMSGSPVLDMNEEVVGVIARLSLVDTHSGLFVTLDRVQAYLEDTKSVALTVRERIRFIAAQASLIYGVDYKLLLALIEVESSYNPKAIGPSGEKGLLQLRPEYHQCADFEAVRNITCGTKFLKYLKDRFETEHGDAWFVYFNHGPNSGLKYPEKTEYYKRVNAVLGRQ